jgi:hypothetical protein
MTAIDRTGGRDKAGQGDRNQGLDLEVVNEKPETGRLPLYDFPAGA